MENLPLPFLPSSASGSGPEHLTANFCSWRFQPGKEPSDLLDPPFSAVAPLSFPVSAPVSAGGPPPSGELGADVGKGIFPPVTTGYVIPVESAWYQLNGGGSGFSVDDLEYMHKWEQAGVPVELVVQVIREQAPRRSGTGIHGFRRPRIYRLRYFHAEIMRRWKPVPAPPAKHVSPAGDRPGGAPARSRTGARGASRSGVRAGGSREKPSSRGLHGGLHGGLPATGTEPASFPASSSLSPEKAGLLRQELCVLLDEMATALESAPRLWAARRIPLPRTAQVCLAGAASIREWMNLIETSHRVCILDLENNLMALDEGIWKTLRDELPPKVITDVLDGFAREDLAAGRHSSRLSPNLVQLEREQRLRRWSLDCHHLPLELTVAGWWESVVVPAGGRASF